MPTRLHNANCRVQAPRWRVGEAGGVPTWGLTVATVWCQKSDAGRAGNHDRRLSRDASVHCTSDTGANVFRPAPGRKPVFFPTFGASDSPDLSTSPRSGTVGAASSPTGLSPNGPVQPEHKCKPAFATWVSGTSSSTPDCAYDGFGAGLSARFVVWFVGVEVSLSVVVHAVHDGVRVATTDCAGIGHPDAGALLFPGTVLGLTGTTWPKSHPTKRSRKCREVRHPSPSNPASRSRRRLAPGRRSIRGPICATAIRSSSLARRPSSLRRPLRLLASVTDSWRVPWMPSTKACRVCGCGVWRVGESTGLPRFTAWGALSGHVEHTGQRSLGLCWRDRQGRSVTRLPAILKNKTEVGQAWAGAPTVGPGNRGADAIESLSANQGSRSERNASDVSDAYWVRTGRNADEKHDLFLCRGVV